MKIVYLSPSGQFGGAETSLLDILASMRAARPDWSLHLLVSDEGPLVQRATALGVETRVIPFPRSLSTLGDAGAGGPAGRQQSLFALCARCFAAGPEVVQYIRALRRYLRELSPDLIHTNGLKMHLLGIRSTPSGVPVIWHIHDYISARPLMCQLLRLHSRRPAMAIANSASVASDVRATCSTRLRVETVYNGVDLERFSPTGPILDLDALAGLPPAAPGTVRVGMLSTLARWKGHAIFLRALSLLPQGLQVRGYVISGALYQTNGSQSSLVDLKKLVQKLDLSQRVGFTGYLERPAEAMRALDIVVHASTEPEPFGLVIAEGMACGRAVIASHAGGAAELITVERDALGHPPGDAELLASSIERLTMDADLRARLGRAARETALHRFDRSRLADELVPLYQAATAQAH
jgi:glycosyltransferase involved in cell wall biosynthesis